jgi:hypothetical protein
MSATTADVRRMHAIIARVRKRDVEVRLVDGWEDRGRPMTFDPRHIVDHHDASTTKAGEWGSLGVITLGRPGIPGPLSQFQIARCLKVPQLAVVAAGRANHAGVGGPLTVDGIKIPRDSANRYAYGAEKANNGLGEPYTEAADYATDVLFASVLEVLA